MGEVLGAYLEARAAMAVGDYDAAARGLAHVEPMAPRWARVGEGRADLILSRPGRARLSARDEARRLLSRVLAGDPGAARVRIRLAEMQWADGDAQAGLDFLSSLDHWRAWVVRARVHADKGREAEADQALAKAQKLAPKACPVVELAEGRARDKSRAAREAAARALVACDPDSEALARFARESADGVLLLGERERLAQRRPGDIDRQVDLARALAAAGNLDRARGVLVAALERTPTAASARLALVDLYAASGDEARAREVLDQGLRRAPDATSLAEVRRVLGGEDPLARWRLDGKAVIRAFQADGTKWDAPAVLVLDRTVVRFLPDATRVTLTHNIVRVLEKDGLDRWGEMRVPDGAEILLARTVKQDGTTREPESLAKEGLTAPDLAVGDYVEIEHVVVDRPQPAWWGGVVGDRFFFGTFEAPLDRTELVVVAPPNLALAWDARGDAPPAQTVRDADGTTITSFAARKREQVQPEPVSPPYAEYVASAVPFAGVDLGVWRAWLAEQIYGARRADRELLQTARRLTAGLRDPRARARALHRFVTEEIDDAGGLTEEPALILSRRRGRRAILLVALAEAAGIRAELWFARSKGSGLGEPPPTQLDELAYPIVRLELPKGPVFLDVRWKRGAFGWLPANVRGAPALAIPDPERSPRALDRPPVLVRLPEGEPEMRRLEVNVDLAADGSARVEAREILIGENAALWRDHAAETPTEEIREELEQRSLGYYFPGSTLRTVGVRGAEDRDAPLEVVYTFDVPHFARDGGVPVAPLPVQLSRRYVLLGTRQTAVALGDGILVDATVRVKLPATVPDLRQHAESRAPGGVGRFVQDVTATGRTLVVKTRVQLTPHARVPAADYAAFTRFCAEVDAAESRVLR